MADLRSSDPFVLNYEPSELQIASEFLTRWLPFLSRDLCGDCIGILSDRVRTLDPAISGAAESSCSVPSTPNIAEVNDYDEKFDTGSLGSWKDTAEDSKDVSNCCSELAPNASPSEPSNKVTPFESQHVRMSWADMAQEDELEEEECEVDKHLEDVNSLAGDMSALLKVEKKPQLSREQRERIRFVKMKRKKDFICLERVNGKIVNILDGLELHSCVFSAAEQRKIVDFVYVLEKRGKNGELKARTYTAPQKWMRGKGRVTIQFGCCYNYATDKMGNPPGILRNELVDPLPDLFKVMIRRLVRWHVIPPSCVPDSCIVNIYDEGDCIPPHIDNHDFVRPFCTVSFLSECNIVFGTNLKAVAAGEFTGSIAISLPVGSVLVLNGKGADVAKHCVPAVPSKRISITFRKMDESKRPIGFVPESDLQGLEPLSCEVDNRSTRVNSPKPQHHGHREPIRREGTIEEVRRFAGSWKQREHSSRSRIRG